MNFGFSNSTNWPSQNDVTDASIFNRLSQIPLTLPSNGTYPKGDNNDMNELPSSSVSLSRSALVRKRHYDSGPGFVVESRNFESNNSAASSEPNLTMFFGRDESYPHELNILIHPLHCELCNTQIMESKQCSQKHYESVDHDNAVADWLVKTFTAIGQNPPAVKRFLRSVENSNIAEPTTKETTPERLYCELCDVKLGTAKHAAQHYEGRRHRLLASQAPKPKGACFYNSQGKWVSIDDTAEESIIVAPTEASIVSINEDSTDSSSNNTTTEDIAEIGNVLEASIKTDISIPDTTTNADRELEVLPLDAFVDRANPFYCKLCKVTVTSVMQMQVHTLGIKHRKRLQRQGLQAPNVTEEVTSPANNCTYLAATIKTLEEDLSKYRTESGTFLCEICNVNLPNGSGFRLHLAGKKHCRNHKIKK